MRSSCSGGSICWVLLLWGRFAVSQTIIPEAQEHFLTPSAPRDTQPFRWIGGYPDLLLAFDADPELYEANNGYVVSFQGKPPELALEVASRHTGQIDVEVKPGFYASLGVQEYWRFDETGEFHGARLAGDRLVDGQYHPIVVDELADGELRGYSETLGLYFCWRQGRLDWYDPSAEDYIPSLESERQLRQQAEERVRQLEAELRQRG